MRALAGRVAQGIGTALADLGPAGAEWAATLQSGALPQVSTLPEGLRVTQVLQRLADETGLPLAELEAAAADPAQLGLPAYANGLLEGFLFPATYDVEPGETAVEVLSERLRRGCVVPPRSGRPRAGAPHGPRSPW